MPRLERLFLKLYEEETEPLLDWYRQRSLLVEINGTGSPDAVTLIDAHHHLWEIGQNKHPGLRGERHGFFMGDNSAIRRDYLPDDYRRDAACHNVLATVHCEAEWERDDQLGETRWVASMHERHGLPTAIVARGADMHQKRML